MTKVAQNNGLMRPVCFSRRLVSGTVNISAYCRDIAGHLVVSGFYSSLSGFPRAREPEDYPEGSVYGIAQGEIQITTPQGKLWKLCMKEKKSQ